MSPATCLDEPSTHAMITVLKDSLLDVFGTMMGMALDEKLPLDGDALRPQSNVVGQIGFGGSRTGLVVFYATFDGAAVITRALLGMGEADEPTRPEIADAIGEIANMVAGSFRTRMATDGDAWAISIPTVTMGSDFYMTPLANGRRTLLPFRMGEHEVCLELVLSTTGPRE